MRSSSKKFGLRLVLGTDTYFKYTVGVSVPRNLQPQRIILKVTGNTVNYIRTKPLHASQTIIEEGPGSMLLELTLTDIHELRALLLSYGPGIEVLAPASLREGMAAMLQESLLPYKTSLSCITHEAVVAAMLGTIRY